MMLKLRNINVTLGKGTKLERQIIKDLSLTTLPEEFVVIIGGNGAGKSTLFNIISGFMEPDSGKIILNNQDVTSINQTSRASMVAKVMQDPRMGVMEDATIFENMAFASKRGIKRGLSLFSNVSNRRLFQDKLSMLDMGLENRLDELAANLSGGQRQALSLIMAILLDSKILLLDEITASLDPTTSEKIMILANKIIREEKRSAIMITHNMQDAINYGDRILVIKDGSIAKEFSCEDKKHLNPSLLAVELM
jgi:putative tryptophan/tyrosine transport system ATP-binding protein